MSKKIKLGFIGCGNMASAIIGGAVSSGFLAGGDIAVFDVIDEKAARLAADYGVKACESAQTAVQECSAVVLAVKPQIFSSLLPEIRESVRSSGTAVISIAAGKSLEYIGSFLGEDTPIVRIMPNINARVGAAMSAFCGNGAADSELLSFVNSLCSSFGEAVELDEEQFPLFSVIAGCSPAFSFMYIDAMARAAVKNGMPKATALKIAAQTTLGSAKMILEDGSHPWELADSVCSPGGTTIEGVLSLKADGFETAVANAVQKALEKDKML